VYCRPAVKPIFVGLGAAAVLAAGGASASAQDEASPAPSDSPTASPTPTPGKLSVSVSALSGTVHPGGTVQMRTHVIAEGGTVTGVKVVGITTSPRATVGGDCTAPYTSTGCNVGELADGHRDLIESTVTVPKSIKKSGSLTFTITVDSADTDPLPTAATVKLVVPSPSPTKTPTKTPTKSPSKSPSPSKSATPSASSSGNRHGSSGGGSGSSSGGSGGTGGTTSGTGYVPPAPNSSFQAKNPQVALPPIAAPSPSIAPNTAAVTPESRLRGNKAPVAQDLTFERVASTQVAWLAALMVAIAVLLTQLRLGKRRAPAGAASAAMRHARGMHRRTRRGMFGK
jgi:hypothetical protein